MAENHSLFSPTERDHSDSNSSVDSEDEVIENITRMLDHAIEMTDSIEQMQESDEDDEQNATQTGIPSCTNFDTTKISNQSITSSTINDQSTKGLSAKHRAWAIQEKCYQRLQKK